MCLLIGLKPSAISSIFEEYKQLVKDMQEKVKRKSRSLTTAQQRVRSGNTLVIVNVLIGTARLSRIDHKAARISTTVAASFNFDDVDAMKSAISQYEKAKEQKKQGNTTHGFEPKESSILEVALPSKPRRKATRPDSVFAAFDFSDVKKK